MKKIIPYLLFMVFLLISCSSENNSSKELKIGRDKIAPGNIKVAATVVKIHHEKLSDDENSPCSKVPCYASIKIDSVLGKGHSFRENIVKGDTIEAHFTFTTGKADSSNFPGLTKAFPGVTEGSSFVSESFYKNTSESKYLVINEYQTIKK